MTDKNQIYLSHIIECIGDIERYTQGNRELFLHDDLIRNATLRQLQVMAESTTRITPELQAALPMIDWRKLAAFRNILVHDYLGELDEKLVWGHIENRLPELKVIVEKMLIHLQDKKS
jgi:uncharacterized protein with HEPN domain